MAAKLVAEEGILKGLVLSLEEGNQWIIGRDPEVCQLLIEDPSASRRHLICHTSPEGVIVENLSTTNPILVNDIAVEEPRLLQNGDTVRIGAGLYRFYAESEAHVLNETTNGEEQAVPKSHPLPEEEIAHIFSEDEPPQAETEDKYLNGSKKKEQPRHDTILEEEHDDVPNINFNISDTGRWLLKVIGGPNNGAEFSMHPENAYLIGTDPNSCDIVFHDNSVSRQHAKINITENGQLFIEDLKSRNGTLVDGETLTGKKELAPNSLVSVGTSSFVVYDREGEMQTIISPLLPSIVKTLQKEEQKTESPVEEKAAEIVPEVKKPEEKLHNALGAFIFIAILTGLFVIVGVGLTTLFKTEPIVKVEQVNTDLVLKEALTPFPNIKYSFNKGTGRLLLVGHVLTGTDKNQLIYNLQGLSFIKSLDDAGIVIDEYVWREINQILTRNPAWKGIAVHSQEAGRFVLTGYLQTRTQAEQLWNYINNNFPYLDLLEKRIIVEEDVITAVNVALQSKGLKNVTTQIANGELTLSGKIPAGQASVLASAIDELKQIQGIRDIKNFVVEAAPDQSMVNVSDEYEVTGASRSGANLSVIINGRILTQGDTLDGMTITNIKPNVIFLEKEGVKYRIDYSH